jgi:hypothetical protein
MACVKKDLIQGLYDLSPYALIFDFVVVVTSYLFYITSPNESIYRAGFILVLVFLARYILSAVTVVDRSCYSTASSDVGKKHFHINAHLAILSIYIMSYNTTAFAKNVIILLCGFGTVLVRNSHTNDAVYTLLLTFTLFTYMKTIPVKNNIELLQRQ